jgi:hypothetical protein
MFIRDTRATTLPPVIRIKNKICLPTKINAIINQKLNETVETKIASGTFKTTFTRGLLAVLSALMISKEVNISTIYTK